MDIHESINRILDSDAVLGDMFYDTFLNRYPQVQKYFEGVNLQRQAVMLMMALLVVEQFETEKYPTTIRYLQELGTRHCEWGIPKETYPYFRDALLDTLKRHLDDDWDEPLAKQWTSAIDNATQQMFKGYKD